MRFMILPGTGEQYRRGSITVEAVLILPIVLQVIFLLISLDFFIHERSWYTMSALEAALLAENTGRVSLKNGQQEAELRMEQRKAAYPLPGHEVNTTMFSNEQTIRIQFKGSVFPVMAKSTWSYEGTEDVQRIDPVKRIRKMRAIKDFLTHSD